jgi:hypothetical protein
LHNRGLGRLERWVEIGLGLLALIGLLTLTGRLAEFAGSVDGIGRWRFDAGGSM